MDREYKTEHQQTEQFGGTSSTTSKGMGTETQM
jgi:hypothetical protein